MAIQHGPLYEIGDTVNLPIPERKYDATRPVQGEIVDRRWNTESRPHYWDYKISHPFDTSGEWRSESIILGRV